MQITDVVHLRHHHQVQVSAATISLYLTPAGLVTLEPSKRPNPACIRFAAGQPSQCWQPDFTHYPLADGNGTEILTWLDNHCRYALRVTGHRTVTSPIVPAAFRAAVAAHRAPQHPPARPGPAYPHHQRRHRRTPART